MAHRDQARKTVSADVLIVGGGFVGAVIAAALASIPLRVVVVDSQDPAADLDGQADGRAFAIALSSQRLLEGTGFWPGLEAVAAPILDIRVSDGPSRLFLHYDHSEIGDQPLGFMVENHHLRRSLYEAMSSTDGLELLAPARLTGIQRTPGGVTAELADGRQIAAALVIAADGRGSWTRKSAGIKLTGWRYQQTAIVCTVGHELSHDFIAHERFLPAGPFAILPLQGDRASIVWTETASLAPEIMNLDDAAFLLELKRRFGDFLGEIEVLGPRISHPLGLQFAETAVAERLALVGDASHAMHPIAGQGLNMGLRDVAALAEVIADAHRLGLDIGSATVLDRYARWRGFDNTLMLAATDGLNRLFSNALPPVRLARDLGLAAVNRIPPLKRSLMRHAMGVVGDLPRLMRGEAL